MKKLLLCWLIAGLPAISFAQPCTYSQQESANYLAQEAGSRIVDKFSGGQNIHVDVSRCDYNIYSETVTLNMKVYWNGIFFSSNHYDISGILKVKSDGTNNFSQTDASSGVQKLAFFRNLLDGTVSLGKIFFKENSAFGKVTNYLGDIVSEEDNTSNPTEFSRGKQEGIKQCFDNPKSCGIVMQDEIASANTLDNQGKQYGIELGKQQCLNNPKSCGINIPDVLVEFNKGKQEGTKLGKNQCFDNPKSCGINIPDVLVEFNKGKQKGIELGEQYCMASYFISGQVHIPCISAFDEFGILSIYNVNMQQQPDSLTFDLDIGSVKLR
jgi:hypothetical protein